MVIAPLLLCWLEPEIPSMLPPVNVELPPAVSVIPPDVFSDSPVVITMPPLLWAAEPDLNNIWPEDTEVASPDLIEIDPLCPLLEDLKAIAPLLRSVTERSSSQSGIMTVLPTAIQI
jgi:hypothetical protein